MSDPVEVVAKHVRALRYAERGRDVGPKVDEEDREIAREILRDLVHDGWWVVRGDTDLPPNDLAIYIREEYRP